MTDSNCAQISLLPGTKYLVRIASNDGPGSFPIEVDTTPNFVQVKRIKAPPVQMLYSWDIYAAFGCAVLFVTGFVLTKIYKKEKIAAEHV